MHIRKIFGKPTAGHTQASLGCIGRRGNFLLISYRVSGRREHGIRGGHSSTGSLPTYPTDPGDAADLSNPEGKLISFAVKIMHDKRLSGRNLTKLTLTHRCSIAIFSVESTQKDEDFN